MVKHVIILLDNDEYEEFRKVKGFKTWKEILELGIMYLKERGEG